MKVFLKIYDYLSSHKFAYAITLAIALCLCLTAALQLSYKEDISDFLPLSKQQRTSMDIYQQISGAERIVIIFEGGDTEQKLDAIDSYAALLAETDSTLAKRLTTQIDMQLYFDRLHWTYQNIPYFLTETDYLRLDSLVASQDFVSQGLKNCKRIMQMPLSGFMRQTLADDPLNLFSPIVSTLQDFSPVSGGFTSLDGYMLTADKSLAFAFLETPYGASETKENTILVRLLQDLCVQVEQTTDSGISIRLLGAPVIAVENASRIKKDSILSIVVAIIFILVILIYCFRHDLSSIPLILLTIGFGWLFGMAVMSIVAGQISIIVLGIGSVIIGIAVNYPLHILFHNRYTNSVRQTLQEVLSPLVIGNITTVGAFLALVPLQAVALRDLGIFAAAMLIGTIIFTIVFLPIAMPNKVCTIQENNTDRQANDTKVHHNSNTTFRYLIIIIIAILTLLLWLAGRDITFDADISHINYMTTEQRNDLARLASLNRETTNTIDVYIVEPQRSASSPEQLLIDSSIISIHSAYRWLPSEDKQTKRLKQWDDFWRVHRAQLLSELTRQAHQEGFADEAFLPFSNTIQTSFETQDFSYFRPLAEDMLQGYWIINDSSISLISKLSVKSNQVIPVEQQLQKKLNEHTENIFDIRTLNSSLASQLSDNFNYIGLTCSVLVFLFLLLSFRSWRAAIVAFLPMAISWVWILGIMQLIGLQFNIVNIILATFIFGQGDDYTIFVIEGLIYEHKTGKRMLPQYRRSIILSAIIMLLGIGVLIIARHPAMHSLGAVTLIGMIVVVILANIVPPLLKNLLFSSTTDTKTI